MSTLPPGAPLPTLSPAPPAPLLQLRGVRKSYGVGSAVEAEVLHGVDLTLQRGEFAALIGPSGSGKSTLLNLIGLLERPSAGTVCMDGQDIDRRDEDALTRLRGHSIGARENVLMPRLNERGRMNQSMLQDAQDMLAAVGLAAAGDKRPGQLSGGMQQRVAIARALVMRPPLVLADEPTGNLDTRSADEVFALMRRLNREQGIAFLIVTHDPRLAERCDRRIEMVDGRIQSDRPT